MDDSLLINVQDASLAYGDKQVLQHISLSIRLKEILTLIGPNGAGKTSLVKIVLGLLSPDTGKIERKPGIRVGYMPQRLHIDQTMPITVRKFLQIAAGRQTLDKIRQTLAEVKAESLLDQQLHSLSGGEMQRVLMARALILDPQLLVLDEPTQGVDINGQAELYQLIQTLRDKRQCGVLMVSHDLHLVMSATDEVICLNHHVCCHGHPEQVSNDPAYLELFGPKQAEALAVYTHHHNHSHDLGGEVVTDRDHDHG